MNKQDFKMRPEPIKAVGDSRRNSLDQSISTIVGNKQLNRTNNQLSTMSHKEMQRALSTYLNGTGPGEYQLPSLVSTKSAISNKKNAPAFSF